MRCKAIPPNRTGISGVGEFGQMMRWFCDCAGLPENSYDAKSPDIAGEMATEPGLFSDVMKGWLGDVDSNHGKQSQSLLSYR